MTEIFVNNVLVDIKDDLPTSLNYAIADILSPEKRNTSFSKTIKLPGTKINNSLFSHIFEISKEVQSGNSLENYTPDFNPALKANTKIFEDNILIFDGVLQLLQINFLDGHYEYEVNVFGQLKNIILNIEGKKLEDLDLSEYDHTFSRARMKESWDTKIQKNGADYVNFDTGKPTGEGYVYPTIDYGATQSPTRLNLRNSYPAIYLREYFVKFFEYAKFTWTSNYLDSDFFRRLIILYNNEGVPLLNDEQVDLRSFSAVLDADCTRIFYPLGDGGYNAENRLESASGRSIYSLAFANDSTGAGFDNSNQYNPDLLANTDVEYLYKDNVAINRAGTYVNKKRGTYDFVLDVNFDIEFFNSGGSPVVQKSNIIFSIVKVDLMNQKTTIASTGPVGANATTNSFNGTLTAPSIFLQKNEYVFATVLVQQVGLSNYNPAKRMQSTMAAGSKFYNFPVSVPILLNDTMYINSAVPKNILIKDLFLSVIKMSNLYVQPDPLNASNLLIEPLVDFYAGADVIDWTEKIDYSKEILIKPATGIEGKSYIFRYKKDSDYYNTDYEKKFQKTYGEKRIELINDFAKGEKVFELIFSPTPSVGVATNSMVIPRIIKLNEDTGAVERTTSNLRLLQYGGVKSAGGNWQWVDVSTLTVYTETTYAFAGHLDDPFNPTVDILFDKPDALYWGAPSNIGSNYTNNNLFNKYYSQFISEVTDKNSKVIIVSARLRPLDIFKLDFKNFIHVDGQNYRLNRILDYNPSTNSTCKVELLKIKAGASFVPFVDDVDGTLNDPINFDLLEGGKDEIINLASITNVDIVDGGKDAVIGLGGINNTQYINGSID